MSNTNNSVNIDVPSFDDIDFDIEENLSKAFELLAASIFQMIRLFGPMRAADIKDMLSLGGFDCSLPVPESAFFRQVLYWLNRMELIEPNPHGYGYWRVMPQYELQENTETEEEQHEKGENI